MIYLDMIRGVSRAIKAETEEEIMNRPDKRQKIVKTILKIVYDAIKSGKNGMTNTEICKKTGLNNRRVREATQQLKTNKMIGYTECRCGHTPIYHKL
tara:strand:- start:3375 stop:3665 length:291 start_codon:yes stop_codon:yes gene_type:complete